MKKSKGYLLLEVVIAMFVFVMVGLSIFTSISFLQLRIMKSEHHEEAVSVLQEGIEIAQNSILVSWETYPDGEYKPAYDVDQRIWVLLPGSEEGVRSRYERKLTLKRVCRNSSSGKRIDFQDGSCLGNMDESSRTIEAAVSWREGGGDIDIKTSLMTFKIPE